MEKIDLHQNKKKWAVRIFAILFAIFMFFNGIRKVEMVLITAFDFSLFGALFCAVLLSMVLYALVVYWAEKAIFWDPYKGCMHLKEVLVRKPEWGRDGLCQCCRCKRIRAIKKFKKKRWEPQEWEPEDDD